MTTTTETFTVNVDYTKTLPEMIAAGNFFSVNPIIYEKFKTSPWDSVKKKWAGSKQAEFDFSRDSEPNFEVISFPGPFGSWDSGYCTSVFSYRMEERGFRPGNLAEILAFREQHPTYDTERPILALGSLLKITESATRWDYWAPVLRENNGHLNLDLSLDDTCEPDPNWDHSIGTQWPCRWRYLAVSNKVV